MCLFKLQMAMPGQGGIVIIGLLSAQRSRTSKFHAAPEQISALKRHEDPLLASNHRGT
jgi:hypothetical protein